MSDNYIVSARKYRPQTFDTVVGQEHITTTLKNAIRHQHLAHAYLFCGPRGVGKTTCARILAKTINCEHPTPEMEACGTCANCQSFKNNNSFNVFELDAASNNSVDDIRNLVDQVRFAPQQGKYKVYIIDEVHMLSAAAFNAFLKTLEEPPPYAIFILATTEKHKILPTILSRCQIFDFKRITTVDIVNHLQGICAKEGMQAQEAALHVIAQKSEGCMRDALSMLDRIASFTDGQLTYANTMEHLNMLDAEYYFKLVDHMLMQDVSGVLLLLDQVLEKGFEGDVILNGLSEHMRNLLLCKDPRMTKLLDVPNEHKPMYHEKAMQAPPSFVLSALNVLNDSELNYKNATNKRLHVEVCLIKLCYVLQATQVDDVKKNADDDLVIPSPQGHGAQRPDSGSTPVRATSQPQDTPQEQQTPPPAAAKPPVYEPAPEPTQERVAEPEPPKQEAQLASPPQSAPQQPATPPPVNQSAPANNGNGSRRLSRNLMEDIEEAVKSGVMNQEEKKELTLDAVQAAFEKYKAQVQQEQKSMLYVQLGIMQLEVIPPDEVRVICPTDFTHSYAKDQRDILIEYFREQTGVPVIRVTTEVREDKEIAAQQDTKVLSRTEMYEEMAKKNPNLARLKDGLNMQIDY